jgi:hypothetical protein
MARNSAGVGSGRNCCFLDSLPSAPVAASIGAPGAGGKNRRHLAILCF